MYGDAFFVAFLTSFTGVCGLRREKILKDTIKAERVRLTKTKRLKCPHDEEVNDKTISKCLKWRVVQRGSFLRFVVL